MDTTETKIKDELDSINLRESKWLGKKYAIGPKYESLDCRTSLTDFVRVACMSVPGTTYTYDLSGTKCGKLYRLLVYCVGNVKIEYSYNENQSSIHKVNEAAKYDGVGKSIK